MSVGKVSDSDYGSATARGNVIVYFSGRNCPHCRNLEGIINRIQGKYRNITFLKYDTDVNSVIANQFRISTIPQIYFYQNGNLINKCLNYFQLENEVSRYYK